MCVYLYQFKRKTLTIMKNLTTMTATEKAEHFAKIMAKINSNVKYVIEDVTPKGYGPDAK